MSDQQLERFSNLQKLAEIVSSRPLMANIARKCDRRYHEVAGTLEDHHPERFGPPYNDQRAIAVISNVMAVHATIGHIQDQIMRHHGIVTRYGINNAIPGELKAILEVEDFRTTLTSAVLNMVPLDVETANKLFGRMVGYLIAANATWNSYQWARVDKGGFFGAANRSNIFSEQSLRVLLLDWDQVVVVARDLSYLLKGNNITRRTTQLQLKFEEMLASEEANQAEDSDAGEE